MNRFRAFMMGRYGADQLTMGILVVSVILNIGLRFVPVPYLSFLPLLLLIWGIYRMMSKNIVRRQMENQKFLNGFWYPISGFFRKIRRRKADKQSRYFRCPFCKQEIRVPRGKGKIKISCPKCGNKFIKKT